MTRRLYMSMLLGYVVFAFGEHGYSSDMGPWVVLGFIVATAAFAIAETVSRPPR